MQKVSIIVPAYNAEQYIEDCIRSIQNQTYSNIEIIVIDDGSTDATWGILERLGQQDDRMKLYSIQNAGVSNARNVGIRHASGRVITFVDSDDYIEPNMIASMMQYYEPGKNVWCGFCERNRDFSNVRHAVFSKDQPINRFDKMNYMEILVSEFLNSPCNKLYDFSKIKENKLEFDTEVDCGEDLLFNIEYLLCNETQVEFVNQPLYHYIHQNADSLTTKKSSKQFEVDIRCYQAVMNLCKIKGIDMSLEQMLRLNTGYFKVLLRDLDWNTRKDRKKLMQNSDWRLIVQFLYQNRLKLQGKYYLETVLVKKGFYEIDRLLRIVNLYIKRRNRENNGYR